MNRTGGLKPALALSAVLFLLFAGAMPAFASATSSDVGKLGPGYQYMLNDGSIIVLDPSELKSDSYKKYLDTGRTGAERDVNVADQGSALSINEHPASARNVPSSATSSVPAAAAGTASANPSGVLSDTPAGQQEKVYSFEGKTYVKGDSWGDHKLTGFCPSPRYGRLTYSGKEAKAKHTAAASSQLPIGTVIIVEGFSGPCFSEFDGVYVVEDRGGDAIENKGILDLFFDTEAEALHVTDAGWNTAHVWIAKETNG